LKNYYKTSFSIIKKNIYGTITKAAMLLYSIDLPNSWIASTKQSFNQGAMFGGALIYIPVYPLKTRPGTTDPPLHPGMAIHI
jgi:hypothetical protein